VSDVFVNDHGTRIKPVPAVLDVVTMISNSRRYASRYRLYRDFEKHMHDSGVRLTTVEVAFGDRPFELTDVGLGTHYIQLRTTTEMWHKENAINIGISRLPYDWYAVAWIDADIHFHRPDWALETLHALQHYDVVQPWTECVDLSPSYEPFLRHRSFCWSHHNLKRDPKADPYKPQPHTQNKWIPWHPGYATALTRQAYEQIGHLLDIGIVGASDMHMAKGLVGDAAYSMHPRVPETYRRAVLEWQDRAQALQRNIGYVDGLISHTWHGPKSARRYWDRWTIITENQFDPYYDIIRDSQGLYKLRGNKPKLRDQLRRYLAEREEDSIHFNPAEGNM
jgi:hypothetical protein